MGREVCLLVKEKGVDVFSVGLSIAQNKHA